MFRPRDPEVAYVIQILQDKKKLLELIGPATDHPEKARWQAQALEKTMLRLQHQLPINPFV
jgi:hypothetical protein